ncbi:hypothetical protein HYX01_04735 [Candidatus Woesearchaeota archaeon]|nr:hypothetical protein [Candidatus Woesearchaeota archaeon]
MAKIKIARKQWHQIFAPKIFNNVALGETYVYEPQQMIGKTLRKNLMELTNDTKKQNMNVNFKVINVQNDKALSEVVGCEITASSVKRMVRRNIEKISMSFLCKTSDNKHLIVKPLFITKSATKGSVAAKIRKTAQEFAVKYVEAITYDNFVNDLITHKLQNSLRGTLNSIYPLRLCEIRSMQLVDLEKRAQNKEKGKKQSRAEKNSAKKKEKRKETSVSKEKEEISAEVAA